MNIKILKKYKMTAVMILCLVTLLALCACEASEVPTAPSEETPAEAQVTKTPEDNTPDVTEAAGKPEDTDYTEGLGETFSGATESATESEGKPAEEEPKEEDDNKASDTKDIDLIFFMGQSNMSGAGGDASQAPHVSPEAGMEFRAVSDPTTLYPITEPFGINENNPSGLHEYPQAKKGSLVSSFINEYHELTGRKVIAVSMSMGATDMNTWISPGVTEDVKQRLDTTVSYLKNNGYTIGHMYALWLHGESDAIGHTDPAVYKTCLDDVMRPLFIGGVRKVFIIMPGRTIDYKDIFLDIIKVQKDICAESDYYAVATTILTKVSTEYMLDMYHYNQHVLNMVGIESAKAVAYYTEHGVEKIVYDYREGKDIVPDGVEPGSQGETERINLYEIDINSNY